MSATFQVGIVGVGNMGGGMAHCLLGKGYSVYAMDIDKAKTEALKLQGAIVLDDRVSIPDACSVVIICVVDSQQIESVLPLISTSASPFETVATNWLLPLDVCSCCRRI